MSYLPAPYESPQQDDLSASVAAVLTTTVGLITAWVFGQQVYPTSASSSTCCRAT